MPRPARLDPKNSRYRAHMDELEADMARREREFVEWAFQAMRAYHNDDVSVKLVAEFLGMSMDYLYKRCKVLNADPSKLCAGLAGPEADYGAKGK